MGQLPQTFTGDRTKADNFIDEVKGYLRLNSDVAGFNSPMKEVAFALTLINGSETAGWTRDIGNWLDGLDPAVDNIPEQFLQEFAGRHPTRKLRQTQTRRPQNEGARNRSIHIQLRGISLSSRIHPGGRRNNGLFP